MIFHIFENPGITGHWGGGGGGGEREGGWGGGREGFNNSQWVSIQPGGEVGGWGLGRGGEG